MSALDEPPNRLLIFEIVVSILRFEPGFLEERRNEIHDRPGAKEKRNKGVIGNHDPAQHSQPCEDINGVPAPREPAAGHQSKLLAKRVAPTHLKRNPNCKSKPN